MLKFYNSTTKCKLSDGTYKTYTYLRQYNYKSQKKQTFFDKLITYDEVKKILKDNSVKNPGKVDLIVNFIDDKEDLKGLSFTQITNFVYRYIKKIDTL